MWKKDKFSFCNKDLPSSLRMLFVGPSGSGKTILLLKLLLYNLDYDKLIICARSLDCQKEYQIFFKALNSGLDIGEIEQIFHNQDETDDPGEEIKSIADIKRQSNYCNWIRCAHADSVQILQSISDKSSTKHLEKAEDNVIIYKDPELMPSPEELRKQVINQKRRY